MSELDDTQPAEATEEDTEANLGQASASADTEDETGDDTEGNKLYF